MPRLPIQRNTFYTLLSIYIYICMNIYIYMCTGYSFLEVFKQSFPNGQKKTNGDLIPIPPKTGVYPFAPIAERACSSRCEHHSGLPDQCRLKLQEVLGYRNLDSHFRKKTHLPVGILYIRKDIKKVQPPAYTKKREEPPTPKKLGIWKLSCWDLKVEKKNITVW